MIEQVGQRVYMTFVGLDGRVRCCKWFRIDSGEFRRHPWRVLYQTSQKLLESVKVAEAVKPINAT